MASLIPDVGNIRTSTDTAGAMNNYLKAVANTREAFAAPVDLIDKIVAGNEARKKTEEEQRRWDITNARADALAKRQEDEYNRALSERTATNEAYRVLMNKDQYANEKMAAEQKAIQESLAMLTPEERAVAEQQLKSYNPEVSRQQWLDNAIGGPNVDQSKVLAMKTNLYNVASNTPGTPEYQAKIDADREQKKWALDLEDKYKMAQIQASKTGTGKDKTPSLGLQQYGEALGVTMSPYDTADTLKMKIKNVEEFNKTKNKETEKASLAQAKLEKEQAKAKGSLFTGDVGSYMSQLDVPLQKGLFVKDSSRLESFIKDPNIQAALKNQKIGSKELQNQITTQLKANDNDLEDALEILGAKLTGGKSTDF